MKTQVVFLLLFTIVSLNAGDVPEPTPDWEGTYEAWDITHPGWRDQQGDNSSSGTDNTYDAEAAAENYHYRQQQRAEEARRRQEERDQKKRAAAERKRQQQLERELEKQRQLEKKQQADQEKQRQDRQKVFQKNKTELLQLMNLTEDDLAMPDALPRIQDLPVTRPAEQVFKLQEQIDNAPDNRNRDQLILRRNRQWQKAVTDPSLSRSQRQKLQLKLPAPHVSVPMVHRQEPLPLLMPRTDDGVGLTLVADLTEDKINYLIEEQAGEIAGDHLGSALALTRITLALKKGEVADAASEGIDFLVGLIPIPQASVAVTGGRFYADMVYRVQTKFMKDAMTVAGDPDFDTDKFWKDCGAEMTAGQKAVMKWIQFGPDDE